MAVNAESARPFTAFIHNLCPICFCSWLVFLDDAIPQADDARAALHHALVMGDENEGSALGVQLIKEAKNFLA
jgi:hypothetical protein